VTTTTTDDDDDDADDARATQGFRGGGSREDALEWRARAIGARATDARGRAIIVVRSRRVLVVNTNS